MAEVSPKPTIFQRLQYTLGGGTSSTVGRVVSGNSYNIQSDSSGVVATASNPQEREMKIAQMRQQQLLSKQWIKAQNDLNNKALMNTNEIRFMYRDCELMDAMPEIGTALDIYAEETCTLHDDGQLIKVTSSSERVKGVLQDLFTNRLAVNVTLPMIARSTCKYGNDFMLLNLSDKDGVLGWSRLPVAEIERYDNGMACPYQMVPKSTSLETIDVNQKDDTRFIWVGQNDNFIGYRNWQIAHFRMLYDSQFLPYGVSILHKARRHFRMLSMMEDMMLLYRLDRSVERRVFNIDVGNIDEADVQAYIEDIANSFKRTPIIDPMTGQIDTRKRLLNIAEDFFIPRRPGDTSSKIETLPAGQNLTAMDDIKYIQSKIFTALRVPRAFLNFEESQGEGKNLSLLDVRFARTVNRVQQMLLMELNKIAIIHLNLLGLSDEIKNFKLTMHNPSSQAEMLEIENMSKKITTAKDAVSDPGGGLPLTSVTWAMKNILKLSNKDIQQILEEQRLEAALAQELAKTQQIIKRTRIYDPVDNIYGEPGAEYSEEEAEGGPGGDGAPGGGGGLGGAPIGDGDFDFGDGGESGAEGEMSMDDAAAGDAGGEIPDAEGPEPSLGESILNKTYKIHEKRKTDKRLQHNLKIQSIINELSNRYPDYDDDGNLIELPKVKQDLVENLDVSDDLNTIVEQLEVVRAKEFEDLND